MITSRHKKSIISSTQPESDAAEAYRSVRTAIEYAAAQQNSKAVVFTSATAGEGTTTVVANLGVLTAQNHAKVLIIDGDLRRPNLHFIFGLKNRTGLSSILTGYSSPRDSILDTGYPGLSLLPAGPIQSNPAELLSSPALTSFLSDCREEYDFIFLDSSPLLQVTDASILGREADGLILVVRSLYIKKEQLIKAQRKLEPLQEKVMGIVMNDKLHHKS